jgi:hypothetical protein
MKLIDIDRLKIEENHVHYIKSYFGCAILMDKSHNIRRNELKFSIEYKPLGDPEIKIDFLTQPDFPITELMPKLKEKIQKMDNEGILSALHKK